MRCCDAIYVERCMVREKIVVEGSPMIMISMRVFFMLFAVCVSLFTVQKCGAAQRFSGSIFLQDHSRPGFVVINPNRVTDEVKIDLSQAIPRGYRIGSSVLTESGIYFLVELDYNCCLAESKAEIEKVRPHLFHLTEEGVAEIPIDWPDQELELYPWDLYEFDDKFYITFVGNEIPLVPKDRWPSARIYMIPKSGGKARELYTKCRLKNFGEPSQRDSQPIEYGDGVICVRSEDLAVVFVHDEEEERLFSLPVGTAYLLKGWYEEGKSLLLWSESPNVSVVVDLQGNVLQEWHHGYGSTCCWNIYGNMEGGILFRRSSTSTLQEDDRRPKFGNHDAFCTERIKQNKFGIYDIRTGDVIPLNGHKGDEPYSGCWSKISYRKVQFERLAVAAWESKELSLPLTECAISATGFAGSFDDDS